MAGAVTGRTSSLAPILQSVILAPVLIVDDFGVYAPLLTSMVLVEAYTMIITARICVFIVTAVERRTGGLIR